MRWYLIIGALIIATLLTACSVNANAGNSDAETAMVKNEDLSVEYTDLVEIIKKAKGTEINLSETTEVILVDGTTGQRIVIDDKDTVKKGDLSNFSGNCFIGIDAGSTTTKLVVIDEEELNE